MDCDCYAIQCLTVSPFASWNRTDLCIGMTIDLGFRERTWILLGWCQVWFYISFPCTLISCIVLICRLASVQCQFFNRTMSFSEASRSVFFSPVLANDVALDLGSTLSFLVFLFRLCWIKQFYWYSSWSSDISESPLLSPANEYRFIVMPGYAEPMRSPEYTVYKIHAKTGTRTTSLILLADCIQKTRPILFFLLPQQELVPYRGAGVQ